MESYKCEHCEKQVTTIYQDYGKVYHCERCVNPFRKSDIDFAVKEAKGDRQRRRLKLPEKVDKWGRLDEKEII